MPSFRITITNRDFNSSSEVEAADASAAHNNGIRGALQIGMDEICKGEPFFAAQVTIERDDDLVDRYMVAMGSSPMS